MLFSGKENVFMCLVVFQKMFRKIFSDVWLCSWKYHRKHIFYLLLTFSHISRLPNNYIISLIPQNTNKTQKKLIGEIAIAIDAIVIGAVRTSRDCDRDQRVRAMRRSRSREDQSGDCDQCYRTSRWCRRRDASIAITRSFDRDQRFAWCVNRDHDRAKIGLEIAIAIAIGGTAPAGDVDGRWCCFLSLSLFYFPRPKVLWSENRNGKSFPLFWLSNSINWKCFSVWPNLK